MDAATLCELVDQRHAVLIKLLKLSQDQIAAIQSGRMTDLMSILSAKQQPVQQLVNLGKQLKSAADDDPNSRQWTDPQARINCRQLQQQCDNMHEKLLEIEAACEELLQANRADVTDRLQRLSSGTDATSGYSNAQGYASAGQRSQLDLSSD
jgi:uncharacterized protein YicC (UPF0701 family)